MRNRTRTIAGTCSAVLLAACAVVLPAPGAAAYDEICWAKFTNTSGVVVAELCSKEAADYTYSSKLYSRGPLYGVLKYMKLRVCKYDPALNMPDQVCHSDAGKYRYYAGPVDMAKWNCPWYDIVVENAKGAVIVGRRTIGEPCAS